MTKPNNKDEKPKQICLLAPFDLAEWIENQSKEDHRSVSGQIVYYLSLARSEKENPGV